MAFTQDYKTKVKFASVLHHDAMLRNVLSGKFVPRNSHFSIEAFVLKVLEQIDVKAFFASLGESSNGTKPLESIRQYFYSAAIKVHAPTCSWMIPSVGRRYEMQHDFLDFYLNGEVKWGIKLLWETDKNIENCGQFYHGDQYSYLSLDQWVVLNFTTKVLEQAVLNSDDNMMHIVYDENCHEKCLVYWKNCEPTVVY